MMWSVNAYTFILDVGQIKDSFAMQVLLTFLLLDGLLRTCNFCFGQQHRYTCGAPLFKVIDAVIYSSPCKRAAEKVRYISIEIMDPVSW